MALIFYGKLTSNSLAAAQQVAITPAMLKVGLMPALVGSLGTKSGMMTAAVGILAIGAASIPAANHILLSNNNDSSKNIAAMVMPAQQADKNRSELWMYYYPEGKAGSVWIKRLFSDTMNKGNYWLQNDYGNYFYDESKRAVNLVNPCMWLSDLSVRRLHTDTAELITFLDNLEGKKSSLQYLPVRAKGILVRDIFEGDNYSSRYEIKAGDSIMDDYYFIASAPPDTERIDCRDEMHQRGWTYFRLSGHIGNKTISGKGRMPFVMDMYKKNYPWLQINVGGWEIIDCPQGAVISPGGGYHPSTSPPGFFNHANISASMPSPKEAMLEFTPGTFFNAIGKPWLGLHTMDIVRREAALLKIPFETRQASENTVEVELAGSSYNLIYIINLEKDITERVAWIDRQGRVEGEMQFTFLQEFANIGDEFIEPHPAENGPITRGGKILWLMELAHVSKEQEREFR